VHSFLHPPLPPVRFGHQGTCRGAALTIHVFDVAQGNDWFKKRDYLKAVEWYTRSLQLDPMSAITVANRAMAHLQLKEYVPPPSPPSAASIAAKAPCSLHDACAAMRQRRQTASKRSPWTPPT
jgi:hypothetical protein